MSKYLNIKILSIAIIIASMMFFITDVFAQGIGYSNNATHNTNVSSTPSSTNHPTNVISPPAHTNHNTNSLSREPSNPTSHACFGRTLSIKNRSSNLIKLINTTTSKFSTITSRIEQYYQNTLSSNGKTLSNYTSLVATINQNKDNLLAEETTLENEYSNFTCSNTASFKTETQSFNNSLMNTLSLLKTYRSSIISLLLALKSV